MKSFNALSIPVLLGTILAFFALPSQCLGATNLYYDAPVLESGVDLQVGAMYRFSNVAVGLDALLTVQAFNNGASIGILDDFSSGGYQGNFQPTINATPNLNGSVDFHFQLVNTGTSTAAIATDVNWSILDVDGSGSMSTRESSTINGFSSYTLDDPTHLGVTDLGWGYFNFYSTDGVNQSGVGTSGAFAVTVHYDTLSSFDVSMGIFGSSGSATNRLFSEGTLSAIFADPASLTVPEPGAAFFLSAAGLLALLRRRKSWL